MKIFKISFLFVVLYTSCGPGGFPAIVGKDTELYFFIVNKNNESIINDMIGPYSSDSKIIDEFGVDTLAKIYSGGDIYIKITDRSKDSLNMPLRKTFYVHLRKNRDDISPEIDTLVCQFVSTYSTDKDESGIEDFSCYYNDSLYKFSSFKAAFNNIRLVKK